ncbi:MAG TPA: hypothetical protein VLV81_02210, partial [Acidimicrobiia bacterium]|nr:hypothetical protein [Acidimicrobiia bacterium]
AVATLSVVGVAAPAAAQDARAPGAAICVRVGRQFGRLVAANQLAKAAFTKAQALHDRLTRAGRVKLAHRLDVRLTHLRAVHAMLVARVDAIAARIQGRCSTRAPTLSDF